MADFLGGLLGGGGGLYDDLLTPQQQSQLSSRGLLSMAGAFADAAMPSRFPVPLGAALGKAAAAMSGGRDEAALKLLQGQKLSQEVQTMKMTADLQKQFMDDLRKLPLDALIQRVHGGGGAPAAVPSVIPGAAPAASAAALTGPLSGAADASFGADLNAATAATALPTVPPEQSAAALFGADSAAGEYGANQYSVGQGIPPPPTGLLGGAPSQAAAPRSLRPAAAPELSGSPSELSAFYDALRKGETTATQFDQWLPAYRAKSSPPGAQGAGLDAVLPSGPGGLLAGGAGALPFGQGGAAAPPVRLANATLAPYAAGNAVMGGPSSVAGVSDAMSQKITDMVAKMPPDIAARFKIISGYRDTDRQMQVNPSAPNSRHGAGTGPPGTGMAVDIAKDRSVIDWITQNQAELGLGFPLAAKDPREINHMEMVNAQGGRLGGQDVVLPSGRGMPANMLQQVADKGGVPGAPAAAGGEGMNTLLLELAKRNAMAEILKLGNPYGSMLSVLQGSPEYKGQIAGAEAKATQPFTQENATHASQLEILKDMAKDNMTVDRDGKIVLLPEAQRIRTMNAEQQAEAKAKWETPIEASVYSPDGTTRLEKVSPFEFRRREADKARRVALGDTMPRPGDLAQTPVQADQQMAPNGILVPDGAGGTKRVQGTVAQAAAAARGLGVPELGIPALAKPPAGSTNAPAVSPVGEAVLTPGQIKTQEGLATHTQARINSYREAADAAVSAKTTLQGISGEIGKVVTGPFADYAQNASLYLNTIAPGFSGQVKAYEDMASQANELVRKAVRASDPNPSFVQTRMAMDSMPIPSKSEGGLYKITNRMIGLQDHDIARGNATQIETPGGAEKFDSWWRQNVSPYAFVFAKLAPDDRDSLINTLQKTAQGKRELETIGKQLQFIEQHGGFGVR